MITLVLIEEEPVLLKGLVSIFQEVADVQIVATADQVSATAALAEQMHPDVLLLGAANPDHAMFETIRRTRAASQATQVVLLANIASRDALIGAVRAGVAGYILKDVEPAELIRGVRAVATGGATLDRHSTQVLLDSVRDLGRLRGSRLLPAPRGSSHQSTELLERERTIVHLIAAGWTNRQIAEVLKLSPHTVKQYVSHVLQKLGVSRRAAIAALDPGILDPEQREGERRHP